MTNIYNLDPRTEGLIQIKTNFGDLEVELFTKCCPNATKNFVQHCLNGYYDNTVFERVEKDFIAIGGANSSHSSQDIPTFPDEFHSRLKFTRRGLLATANTKKNENGPKFFFTLNATPELQNKHTIFGRVKGNSVYTLVDLNECRVDQDFRPYSEKKIIEVNVLDNPFPDLEIQIKDKTVKQELEDSDSSSDDRFETPRITLDKTKKLSFNYEEEDEEEEEKVFHKPTTLKEEYRPSNRSQKSLKDECDEDVIIKPDLNKANRESRTDSEDSEDENEKKSNPKGTISPTEKEKKLQHLRAEIEKFKQQLDKQSKVKSSNQDESRKRPRDGSHDDSDDITLLIAPKKSKHRERETIELLRNFKKKLKATSKKFECTGGFEEPDLDQVDGDDWLNHKFND